MKELTLMVLDKGWRWRERNRRDFQELEGEFRTIQTISRNTGIADRQQVSEKGQPAIENRRHHHKTYPLSARIITHSRARIITHCKRSSQ